MDKLTLIKALLSSDEEKNFENKSESFLQIGKIYEFRKA
jgi:hypothetical protein